MTRLLLVRHGESVARRIEQAADVLLSSTLPRAVESAEILA